MVIYEMVSVSVCAGFVFGLPRDHFLVDWELQQVHVFNLLPWWDCRYHFCELDVKPDQRQQQHVGILFMVFFFRWCLITVNNQNTYNELGATSSNNF